jgi:putative DNA primase/helicase
VSFDADRARAMLAHLSPDLPRDEWVKVGMALKSELGDGPGFEVFDEWSRGGAGYSESGTRTTWRSLKAGGKVGGGTLVRMAQAAGWKPADKPRRQTPAERAAAAAAQRKAAEREARETEARHRKAAAEAAALWERGQPADGARPAPYLQRKGVGPHGVRVLPDGTLLIPLRDAAGALWNVQRIAPRPPAGGEPPEKLFTKGARKSGLWHLIGPPPGAGAWLMLAEGYATAATVHEATGRPVAVAFDAGNLQPVAAALRQAFPGVRLAVAGDDDRPTAQRTGRNPGREAAEAVAAACSGPALLPRFPAGAAPGLTDWNDLHQLQGQGLDAVREQIEAGLRAFEAALPAPGAAAPADGEDGAAAGDKPPPSAAPAGDGRSEAAGDTAAPPGRSERPQDRAKDRAKDKGRGRAATGRNGGGGKPDDEGDTTEGAPRFECDDSGLWRYLPPGRDGDGGGWQRVSDPLRVEALARDQADGATSLVLSFRSRFGDDRRLILPAASVAGDGGAWRVTLADAGFHVPARTNPKRWLGEYLTDAQAERHARLTERTGWHGSAFVLPAETIGGDDAEAVLFSGEKPDGGLSQAGDLQRWQQHIGRHCIGQSRLIFAVSMALAAPCLRWTGAGEAAESGGFHLHGGSSSGKTTALRGAASVYGPPAYVQRWRATDNGLEALAAAHSDLPLMLDELAQMDPKVTGDVVYMIGNGWGKSRAARSGGSRPRLRWRLLVLSSGEIGLSDHMAEAGKRPRAGQELRFVDLPADAGQGFGAFDHRGDFEDSAALSRHLDKATSKFYGTLGRAWLEHLAANTEGLSAELRQRMAKFEAQAVPETASGQVGRVARRFALVAAAGEMATAAGLTGWPPGQAQAATLRLFNAWIEARPAGIGDGETAAMLRQVRAWFELHSEARFTSWDRVEKGAESDEDRRPQTLLRAGWRKRIMSQAGMETLEAVEYMVLPEVFRNEIAKGWNDRAVLRLLAERGHLKREKPNENASRVRPPNIGHPVSVYRIRSTLLNEGEE